MVRWCWRVYLPWRVQKQGICVLTVAGTMVGWMFYFSGHHTRLEVKAKNYQDEWDKQFKESDFVNLQDIILLYTFWVPVVLSMVVCGLLVDMVGPRNVWGPGFLLGLVPAAAFALISNPLVYVPCAVIGGLSIGVFTPCSSAVVAYWAAENERTLFVAVVESGMFLGWIVNFLLHEIEADVSWSRWLLLSCVVASIWIILWYTLFFNHPGEHPQPLPHNLRHIRTRIRGVLPNNRPRKGDVPWKSIFLSPPYLSLLLLSVAASWVHSLIGYQMIKYLSRVHMVTSIINGGFGTTALVMGVALCSVVIHGWIIDRLISSGLTSRTSNRRFFLVSTCFVSAVLLVTIPWLEGSTTWVVITFYSLTYVQGISFAAISANVVDLSPRYSGLLRGVQSAIRDVSGILCRFLVYKVVNDSTDCSWAPVFLISAAISAIFPLPYIFFGSGEIQYWNFFRLEPVIEERTVTTAAEDDALNNDEEKTNKL